MKIRVFVLTVAFASALNAAVATSSHARAVYRWAGGGSQAGNGRSIYSEELQAKRVFRNMGRFIDKGLKKSPEVMTADETARLKVIRLTLLSKGRLGQRLRFVSGYDQPEKFYLDDRAYAIWTEGKVGGEVWLNTDFLDDSDYPEVAEKDFEADLASVFLSALVDQSGESDEAKVQELADVFAKILKR